MPSVYRNGNGFRWQLIRGAKSYRGPTVPTQAEAETLWAAAIAALARGEEPEVAKGESRGHPIVPPRPWGSNRTPIAEGADEAQPEVQRIRRKLHVLDNGRVRSKTIAPKRLTMAERRVAADLDYPDVERPKTRGDCMEMPRPCPFVSCSAHLFLEVNEKTGAIKLNYPHLNVWQMAETCSLDVADRGGLTLEAVGALTALTRERIRQIEVRGLSKIKNSSDGELDLMPEQDRQ